MRLLGAAMSTRQMLHGHRSLGGFCERSSPLGGARAIAGRWSKNDVAILIDTLAETPPDYHLPEGAIHAHTRHYMPQGRLEKGREKTSLVFDGFVHMPERAEIVAVWPNLTLSEDLFKLATDLAETVGYLGRAESWTECRAVDNWCGETNCRVMGTEGTGTPVRVLAPRSPAAYAVERSVSSPMSDRETADKAFRSKASGADTLPARLIDALALDTADFQDRGWSRPPASCEVVYMLAAAANHGVTPRTYVGRRNTTRNDSRPTVARYLMAGRPLPRVEDSVKIAELMRRAALAQFGWTKDETTGRTIPRAPWQISGRQADGQPVSNPAHPHAFWLPEDADSDGWIDHISVYIQSGIDDDIRAHLDRITRLWLPPKLQPLSDELDSPTTKEWRLALEGFGDPSDFAGSARIFDTATKWQSVTPFLAAGYLKTAGYAGEVSRLLKRRGFKEGGLQVEELESISVGGTERRAIHFHRFRSRGGEKQPDTSGTFIRIVFPRPITRTPRYRFRQPFRSWPLQT